MNAEALAAAEEAVTLFRHLTETDPTTYRPNLATALNNLGLRLEKAGKNAEAITTTEAAITPFLRLSQTDLMSYLPSFLNTLGRLSGRLGKLSGTWRRWLSSQRLSR